MAVRIGPIYAHENPEAQATGQAIGTVAGDTAVAIARIIRGDDVTSAEIEEASTEDEVVEEPFPTGLAIGIGVVALIGVAAAFWAVVPERE
jgi:hypothetical protein